jgi:hypothetical protein
MNFHDDNIWDGNAPNIWQFGSIKRLHHLQDLITLEYQFSMSSYRVSLLSRKLQGEGDRAQTTQIKIPLSPLLYPGSLHLLPSAFFMRDI